ncbi:serine hydrolase [Simkania negevensis]|uniref:Penicillin-binding protein n=1 Tax=Simkania negevensis (strain ATCC VR-1471 / DSM 27360 / Z) TaxID=331113 RepID=F8L8T3_SIMNZ|nr:serine hydrolase [Simkania negevensis]CCB89226.1 penicillin-binding protein [Simkania negevensis Z]
MKRILIVTLLFLFGFVSFSYSKEPSLNQKLERIDSLAQQARETFHLPGLAVGIVMDGELVYAKGYGYRDIDKKLPVTEETVFMIGSMTKAFTTFALATLVEQGKISWNDKVISYLPDFRLKDSYSTQEMTIRDLVTHVSGLPRHDLVWFFGKNTTDELYQKLQYLEPITSFREGFSYQNLMYMVAGKVIEKVTGQDWESYVKEKILIPLGMGSTTFSIEGLNGSKDFAAPYILEEATSRRIPYHDIRHVGPAGTINSNLLDLAAWTKMLLNFGQFEEKQLLGSSHIKHLMSPQVVASLTVQGFPLSNDEFLEAYGFGWMIQSFYGRYLVSHGGAIDGFNSNLALLSLDKIGVCVLSNQLGPNALGLLTKSILATLLDEDVEKWLPKSVDVDLVNQEEFPAKKGTSPSHDLKHYVGVYEHPAYGKLEVFYDNGLQLNFHEFTAALNHLHYDIFQGEIKTPFAPFKLSLSFETDWYGNVRQVVLPIQFEGIEVPFVKKPQSNLSTPEYLEIYAGEYTLQNTTIKIFVEGKTLKAEVSGQPLYELVPKDISSFSLKGHDNIHFEFVMKNGTEVEILNIVQPQGVFKATPK